MKLSAIQSGLSLHHSMVLPTQACTIVWYFQPVTFAVVDFVLYALCYIPDQYHDSIYI